MGSMQLVNFFGWGDCCYGNVYFKGNMMNNVLKFFVLVLVVVLVIGCSSYFKEIEVCLIVIEDVVVCVQVCVDEVYCKVDEVLGVVQKVQQIVDEVNECVLCMLEKVSCK